jgi:hypothetical protein
MIVETCPAARARRDQNRCAGLAQLRGHGLTDSLRTAGDERATSCELAIGSHRYRALLGIEELPDGSHGRGRLFFHQPMSRTRNDNRGHIGRDEAEDVGHGRTE